MKFTEILQNYGVQYREYGQHHHVTPGWIAMDCPYCSPNWKKFRLGFHLTKRFFSCWACHHCNLLETLSLLLNESQSKCRSLLGFVDEDEAIRWERKPRGKLVLPDYLGPLLPPHQEYLEERGFSVNWLTDLYHLQGIGIAAKLQWRIFIPVEYRGVTVSWTTRSINDNIPARYIHAAKDQEAFPMKDFLYGEDHCDQVVIIVEGPADVWAIGPGAVATMGVNYSVEQKNKISQYSHRVICFDADEAGQNAADKLERDLYSIPGINSRILLETGKDAASADPKEIQEIRQKFLFPCRRSEDIT